MVLGWALSAGCVLMFLAFLITGLTNGILDAVSSVFLLMGFLALATLGIILVIWGKRTKMKEAKNAK